MGILDEIGFSNVSVCGRAGVEIKEGCGPLERVGKMTIGKVRKFLYGFAKFLGDVNAVKQGTVGKRVRNRVIGKFTGRLFK
ncbi:hypothetical protein [Bacillus swezeyi]|uniref:hypothetical protein n=1 Tax=Bacillus swezeyi TaxID=1925020 RepID=UPI0027DAF990|nr:hypothetical protein [Bacillus swezeyi]